MLHFRCNTCYLRYVPGTAHLLQRDDDATSTSRLDVDGRELPLRRLASKLSRVRRGFDLETIDTGLAEALDAILTRARRQDPLADLDAPLASEDAAREVAVAEAEAAARRAAILRDTVSAEEATRLTGRSRQSLERFRRQERVLVLRQGNQWRYPPWQFDREQPGGLVPGIAEAVRALRLSAVGAAYWLVRRHPAQVIGELGEQIDERLAMADDEIGRDPSQPDGASLGALPRDRILEKVPARRGSELSRPYRAFKSRHSRFHLSEGQVSPVRALVRCDCRDIHVVGLLL